MTHKEKKAKHPDLPRHLCHFHYKNWPRRQDEPTPRQRHAKCASCQRQAAIQTWNAL